MAGLRVFNEAVASLNAQSPVTRVLLVDDDAELAELVGEYLGREGFLLEAEADGTRAVDRVTSGDHQLVVLDVMLPGVNGFDVLRSIRATSRIPVLMLTARGDEVDRIVGLELGADDYLSKPFEPRELVLRIRNVLQRRPIDDPVRRELRFGGCRFDLVRGELYRGGDPVHLTAAEAALLSALAQKAPRPVPREELALSAQFSGNVRNVDVQMTRLRRKIERDPRFPRYLQTVRGTGYALRPD